MYIWALLACLCRSEKIHASSGQLLMLSTVAREGFLGHRRQIVVECGGDYCLSFSLISSLLSDDFCSNPSLTQVQPPLLQGPGAWNRLASMWMSDYVMLKQRLLDRHWLTRRERVTWSFKCLLIWISIDNLDFFRIKVVVCTEKASNQENHLCCFEVTALLCFIWLLIEYIYILMPINPFNALKYLKLWS